MRKLPTCALALMLAGGVPAILSAQETTTDADVQRAAQAADQEDRGEWGWIGLLGLAGLLGLRRRDRDTTTVRARV